MEYSVLRWGPLGYFVVGKFLHTKVASTSLWRYTIILEVCRFCIVCGCYFCIPNMRLGTLGLC